MDWVRSNKFLAGFIAAMVVGVGAMGYLLYVTRSQYEKTSQEYTTQVEELKRLEKLEPYPEEANLKLFADQKKAFADAVMGLQANLAAMSAPAEKPLTPTEFQNRLREIVSDVLRSATQFGVGVPTDFYLGFEEYRARLPDAAASALLTTQLSEIERIVRILVNRKVDKINLVKRALVPGEGASAAPAPGPGEKVKTAPVNDLVTRQSVEVGYTASPNAFRETMQQIIEEKRLFLIRALQVKNQNDKGPVRGADVTVPGGQGRPGAASNAAAAALGDQPLPEKGPAPLRYVVGQEKVEAVMHIELVRVSPPK